MNVGAGGGWSSGHDDIVVEHLLCALEGLIVRHADPSDSAAWADNSHRRVHCLLGSDTLQDRLRAEAARQLTHAFDAFLTPLADHVGRAKLLRKRDTLSMAAHDDDLLRAKPLGCYHSANADGTIADDRHRPARLDAGSDSCVMASPHHV